MPDTVTHLAIDKGPRRLGTSDLMVACPDVAEPETLTDPDGNELVRWPSGRDGITHWALELATPSVDAFMEMNHLAGFLPELYAEYH